MEFTSLGAIRRVFPSWCFRYSPVCVVTPDGPWKDGYSVELAVLTRRRPPFQPLYWAPIGCAYRYRRGWAFTSETGLHLGGFDSRQDAVQFLAAMTFPEHARAEREWARTALIENRDAWRRLLAA